MKRITYLSLLFTLMATATVPAISGGFKPPVPPAFSRYQGILERMPFGAAPAANSAAQLTPADARSAAQELKDQQLLARQINMSCVNTTPAGKIAVGFTDMAVKPPISYYLLVGDSSNGWLVKSADYDEEWAELEKDGVAIYVKLGEGLMAEPPEIKKPQAAQNQVAIVKRDKPQSDPQKKPATEKLILTREEQFVQHAALELESGIPSPVTLDDVGTYTEEEKKDIAQARQQMFAALKAGQEATTYRERLQLKMEQAREAKLERERQKQDDLVKMAAEIAKETINARLKEAEKLNKEQDIRDLERLQELELNQ